MNMNYLLITGAAVVVAGGLLYYFYKKGGTASKLFIIDGHNSETIEGELKLSDVVSYFKLQNLKESVHTPFMANWNSTKIRRIVRGERKAGYEAIFAGAYNTATDEIEIYRVFFAKSLDAKIKEAMGDESLVVLA